MGANPISNPITVSEYARIPDPPGGRYELHHGELVFVTFPVRKHKELQRRLRRLLESMAEPAGFIVDTAYPYRPRPENEVWGADVACVSGVREAAVEKWLAGSPELVIEVKSPSNTLAWLNDKAMTTLSGAGASEFWVVDEENRSVTVHHIDFGMKVYSGDETVPVALFGGRIDLKVLFADL